MSRSSAFAGRMDRFLEAYCRAQTFSGMLRVTHHDEVIYARAPGMADFERQIPFDEHSVFTLYSLSKPFCVLGFMKLCDKGLIDLEAHPSRYLPEARGLHPGVTLRQMLHHVSGLPDFEQTREFAAKHAPGSCENLRRHVELIGAYPQRFEPGTQHFYANINMILPALIIENLTGLDYGDYMAREVFQPLGMESARVDVPGLQVNHRVQGYTLEGERLTPVERSTDWMRGAGDLMGTVEDVYRLNRAIKQRKLLSERAWREVLTPSPVNGMGMGCTISQWNGKYRITHNGGHTGFRTLHIQLPEDDFDIILLSNCGFGNARADISDAICEAFYGSAQPAPLEMDKGYIQ